MTLSQTHFGSMAPDASRTCAIKSTPGPSCVRGLLSVGGHPSVGHPKVKPRAFGQGVLPGSDVGVGQLVPGGRGGKGQTPLSSGVWFSGSATAVGEKLGETGDQRRLGFWRPGGEWRRVPLVLD